MNHSVLLGVTLSLGIVLLGCDRGIRANQESPSITGPVSAVVIPELDFNHFKVDHPEQFPLVVAGQYTASPKLEVTGVVSPDVSRQVPVISLASGRIVEIDARLGDMVHKGQLLYKVRSSDVAGAFSNYLQAVKNEQLTKLQLDRAKVLYEHGAISRGALEIAQNAEDDNVILLNTAREQLGLLGLDPERPSGIVDVYAPVSGVITDQEITNGAGVQALSAPSPFTISDISHLWVLCDVYENELSKVQLGEYADIHANAYPNILLKGRISNISPILDPNLRTAKVRLEIRNPGFLRLGMFVTATFYSPKRQTYATVPSTAILHLHDRQWVYIPIGNGYFRRLEVVGGELLPNNMQEVLAGIKPGMKVVANALDLEHTVSQ
ncbi:MAG TPA: efflux RND transporter periplasmic adaptor subunit [Candidatus Angelobacter sp.]|nr:efflux RND transporter periplasmic adaptor subunit [Candidatus Angelobacter sp.]